ncbi:MAG: glycosyltransferase family 39 protein [Phycisphaerales bacterium]
MSDLASTDGSCLRVPGRVVRWWARWWCYVAPAVYFLVLTLPHLGQGGFRTDTGRYAAVGLQMWRTGEFWTPYLQPDTAYFSKPPLVLWIHGAVLRALGVGVWQARVPSVVAGLGCVLVTVAIARRYANRTRALAVGVALATTLEFFRRTKEISIDMWQALFLLGAVWCVSVAVTGGRRYARWFALAGVGVGLALMCKPIAALLAVPILGVWMVGAGEWRRVGWLGLTVVVALLVAGPWHVCMAVVHGSAFTGRYFGDEVADRAAGEIMRDRGFTTSMRWCSTTGRG